MIETDIYTVLTSASTITDLVGDNIFNHHLPDNFDLDNNAIVFIVNKEEGISSLQRKNELENHSLEIIVVGSDTITIENIVSEIETELSDYDDGVIRDCTVTDISPTLDAEKDRYIKKIIFNVIYSK